MTGFYGFDFQNNPNVSRLFAPNVTNKAQAAYGQGMGMWKPQDPEQIKRMQEKLLGRQPQQQLPTENAQASKAQMDKAMLDSLNAQFMSLVESGRAQGSMIPVTAQLQALQRAMAQYGGHTGYF